LSESDRAIQISARLLPATAIFKEMMLLSDSKDRDITASPTYLDFGSCSALVVADKQVVTVTNRTSQKVSVVWMLAGETCLPCMPDEKVVFSVYPVQCDIKAGDHVDFSVSFHPLTHNKYEGEILEAVVFQKNQPVFPTGGSQTIHTTLDDSGEDNGSYSTC
jgi:hypothetical protein